MSIKFLLSILCVFATSQIFPVSKYEILILDEGVLDVEYSQATSINEKGQVCGKCSFTGEPNQAFFWDPISGFKKIEIKNHITTVIKNGGKEVEYRYVENISLNNKGAFVVGYRGETKDINGTIKVTEFREFFIVNNEKCQRINIPDCICNHLHLVSINNNDQILFIYSKGEESSLFISENDDFFNLGHSIYSAAFNDNKECFVAEGTKTTKNKLRFVDLKIFGYKDVLCFKSSTWCQRLCNPCDGLNNRGTAIGRFKTHSDTYGYSWNKEEGLRLYENFVPSCINNKDQIVGCSVIGGKSQTFLKEGQELISIDRILNLDFDFSSQVRNIYVCGINDSGQMVGAGALLKSDSSHAILLNPID